jgi:hypothetical protein
MALDQGKLYNMSDAQIAEAITRGDINNLSNDDWLYLNRTHPIA